MFKNYEDAEYYISWCLSKTPNMVQQALIEKEIFATDKLKPGISLHSTGFGMTIISLVLGRVYSLDTIKRLLKNALKELSQNWDRPYIEILKERDDNWIFEMSSIGDDVKNLHKKIYMDSISIPDNDNPNPGERERYVWSLYEKYLKVIEPSAAKNFSSESLMKMGNYINSLFIDSLFISTNELNLDDLPLFEFLFSMYSEIYNEK